MPKFKIAGTQVIVSGGEEYREGDTIELSAQVALEFRGQLIPADKEAELVFNDATPLELKGRRKHEREGLLLQRKEQLIKQLANVDALLVELKNEK